MSETTLPTFTDEEIDEMPRADLHKHLKERDEPAGGTNGQLIERLKEWCAAQGEADDEPDDADETNTEGDAEDPPVDQDPPEEKAETPAPPTEAPTKKSSKKVKEEAEPVKTRGGGPRRSSFGKTLRRDEPAAKNFVKECKKATLIRLHSTNIVQRIDIPYGLGGRARALALFGIDLKGYINEELASED